MEDFFFSCGRGFVFDREDAWKIIPGVLAWKKEEKMVDCKTLRLTAESQDT